jgi:GNAT superfamily N-acetyltransferase
MLDPRTSPAGPLDGDIIPITQDMLEPLQELHTAAFGIIARSFVITSLGVTPNTLGYMFMHEHLPVGEITLQWMKQDSALSLYIDTLSVKDAYRGRGIGTHLLRHAITECSAATAVYLHVQETNYGAIAFYEKHGFVRGSLCPSFYPDAKVKGAYLFSWTNPSPTKADPDILEYLRSTGCNSENMIGRGRGKSYEVEQVVGTKMSGPKRDYLIRWCGYTKLSWENADDLNCQYLVDQFWATQRAEKPVPPVVFTAASLDRGVMRYWGKMPDGSTAEIPGEAARTTYAAELLDFLSVLAAAKTS